MSKRSRLFVEGIDDAHAIRNVLWDRGWREGAIGIREPGKNKEPTERLVVDPSGGQGRVRSGNDDGVLRALATEVETAESSLGAVLDADEDRTVAQRWDQLRYRLEPLGVAMPGRIEPEGFVGEYASGDVRIAVGAWLMPDNRREGGIEAFLADLAVSEEHRPVLDHARASTQALVDSGRRTFSPSHRLKAELRAFLAWQDEPGCPYGRAVAKHYFDGSAEAAGAFAAWFRRLFGEP